MPDLLPQDVNVLCYEHGIYALDSGYLRPRLAAIHLIVEQGRALIIDTASHTSHARVLDALRVLGLTPASVDYVFLTHIHLDHAGGAGRLMQICPEARLVAHPRGTAHMADPTKLFAAVRAVYGAEEADRLYGEPTPVPADRMIVAGEGDHRSGGPAFGLLGHARPCPSPSVPVGCP